MSHNVGYCECGCHNHDKPDAMQARERMEFSAAFVLAQQSHRYQGVPVTDVTEAAAACPACLNNHAPALLARFIWRDDPPPPDPAGFCAPED